MLVLIVKLFLMIESVDSLQNLLSDVMKPISFFSLYATHNITNNT